MSERLKIDHCPKCGEFLHDEMGHSCPAPSEPVGTPPKCPTCGSVSHGPAEINYLMPCRDSWHDSPAPSEPEPLIGHITKGDVRKCLAEDHSECEPSADWAELERMRKALREICKNSPTDADFEIGGRYDYGEDCGNSGRCNGSGCGTNALCACQNCEGRASARGREPEVTITRDDKLWLYQLAETIVVAMRGDAMHLRETYKELLSGKEDDGDEREA